MIRTLLLAITISLTSSTFALAQGPRSNQYIVSFSVGTSQAQRAAAVQRAGAAIRYNYSTLDAVAIAVANANALAALRANPNVTGIVPDRPVYAIQSGNGNGAQGKPSRKPGGGGGNNSGGGGGSSSQVIPEGVKRVGVPTGTSGAGVGVAIVDTGIDLANSDLAPAGQTFTAYGTSCQDDNGHGTHVTGTVAALNNSTGVVGVAPAATPYCVKVLDASGSGSDSDVMAGLEWVLANADQVAPPIRVVNMSLGRAGSANDNPDLRTAVHNLWVAGITVVVAAGNDPTEEVQDMVPASYSEVLAVASTTATDGANQCRRFHGLISADTASFFTTDGGDVTISAPGEDKEDINKGCMIHSTGILSTKLGGGTTRMSGTSMATPHVTGIVARVIQEGTSGVENIRAALQSSAQNEGSAPFDSPTSTYTFDGVREGIAQAP